MSNKKSQPGSAGYVRVKGRKVAVERADNPSHYPLPEGREGTTAVREIDVGLMDAQDQEEIGAAAMNLRGAIKMMDAAVTVLRGQAMRPNAHLNPGRIRRQLEIVRQALAAGDEAMKGLNIQAELIRLAEAS